MPRARRKTAKARRLRQEAESQLELLTQGENVVQADFYSYRYFASEGFLPGYSFPRLPLSAFIPGRNARRDATSSSPARGSWRSRSSVRDRSSTTRAPST